VSSIEGMKVLLLDPETIQIISMVYSQVRGWVGAWVGE
jgi:phage tail tape-measure protein